MGKDVNKQLNRLLLLIVALAATHTQMVAQAGALPIGMDKRLIINGTLSLDSLTRLVHRQTHVRFSFNSVRVKGSKQVPFVKGRYTVAEVLRYVQQNTSLYWSYYNGYIIFQDNPTLTTNRVAFNGLENRQQSVKNSLKRTNSKLVITRGKASTSIKKDNPLPTKQVPVITYQLRSPNHLPAILLKRDMPLQPITSLQKRITAETTSPPTAANKKRSAPVRKKGWRSAYVQTGMFATDVLYTNVTAEAGINALHLTLSAGTNYPLRSWGIGLASIVKEGDKSYWQVAANVNFIGRQFTVLDTVEKAIYVDGTFYRAGLYFGRDIGSSRWQFKLGANFYLMHTRYSMANGPRRVADLPYKISQNEDALWLLKPPFLLSNNFDVQRYDNIKKWIGFSAGFYFRIF